MKEKCTMLVNSCDSYEDTWYPFFKLLKKYWPNREIPIVLNTETKQFDYEDMDIRVINLPKKLQNKKYVAWGKRMIEVLKRINSKYILFMLDDFFLTDFVDEKKIVQAMDWMEENDNITVFSFYPVSKSKYPDAVSLKYQGYSLRNKKGHYRYNCQAALWRKDDLIKCFKKNENPWEWELVGNKRSSKSNKEFYALEKKDDIPFKYYFCDIGIVKGKWKLPETAVFFDKENIKIDFNVRNQMHDMKIKKIEEEVKNAKNRGKMYYFMYRVKRRLKKLKDKIMSSLT